MIMSFWVKLSPQFSSISSNPLVSSIVTLHALLLLYLPSFVFSPVLAITAVLLLSLLRLGAAQRSLSKEGDDCDAAELLLDCNYRAETESDSDSDPETEPGFEHSFVEWNLRAPLEVIYEDHEEEDEEASGTGRYENLSRFYPESDSGDSSEDDLRFEWEEEEEEEDERNGGLIEIALDGDAMKGDWDCFEEKERGFDLHVHVEEENLIEIDISPVRNR